MGPYGSVWVRMGPCGSLQFQIKKTSGGRLALGMPLFHAVLIRGYSWVYRSTLSDR